MLNEAGIQATLHDHTASTVLQACLSGVVSAKDIKEQSQVPVVTVYRHLRRLEQVGLVVVARSAITPSGRPYDLYRATVEWASLVVSARGIQVDWKKRESVADRMDDMWRQMGERL